jgi:hypothetical protein
MAESNCTLRGIFPQRQLVTYFRVRKHNPPEALFSDPDGEHSPDLT